MISEIFFVQKNDSGFYIKLTNRFLKLIFNNNLFGKRKNILYLQLYQSNNRDMTNFIHHHHHVNSTYR